MALAAGSTLGHYEVQGLIGKGGMGEVYRGYDTKLQRDVTLKLLPPQFARDPERLARFRREATMLAALNHPNIAQIYGFEDSGDTHYLVMEFVPGLTLAELLFQSPDLSRPAVDRKGGVGSPVEVDEALRIGSQICEALEHAHEKNIIHRDLKPANVKLTPEGKVKVLDFGLARAFAGESAAGAPAPAIDSNSPTLSRMPEGVAGANASPTLPGVILGTAAYMSPEQAKGKTVDRRTDIWALGCVLYELLTRSAAFSGESVTEILGAVMRAEPEWSLLPAETPASVRALLRRCLRKDAQQRPRDAADIRLELDDARASAASPISQTIAAPAAPAPRRWLLLGGVACVVAAMVGGLAVWTLRPGPAVVPLVSRAVIPLDDDQQLAAVGQETVAVSPDGKQVAYIATSRGSSPPIYLRATDSLEARPISGIEGAGNVFFSPDGQWIGFFAPNVLKKVSVNGGAAITLCSIGVNPRGATWGPNDAIVFTPGTAVALSEVPAAGGPPQLLTKLTPPETSHRWPQFLPGGKAVLYTIGVGAQASYQDAQIAAVRLDTGEQKLLIRGGTYGRYVPTGHLVYYTGGTVMAVPFDPVRLEVRGTPAPVVEGVMSGPGNTGAAQFGFSDAGSLVYVPGGVEGISPDMLVWVDRKGTEQPVGAPPRIYGNSVRLSPDGRRIASAIDGDIWVYDIGRGSLSRLTFDGAGGGHWSPDGTRVIFNHSVGGKPQNLFWKAADGSGSEERLGNSDYLQQGGSISPDGKWLVFHETRQDTLRDILVAPMEGERKPRVFLQTKFQEGGARMSPDGRWIAYTSDESGRTEVYVQPFPGPGGKWQISTEGGGEVVWNPNGREIFYRAGNKIMAADIPAQSSFSAGRPRAVVELTWDPGPNSFPSTYDVSPDGQRFLLVKPPVGRASGLTQINMVLNWFEELKQKVPVK